MRSLLELNTTTLSSQLYMQTKLAKAVPTVPRLIIENQGIVSA